MNRKKTEKNEGYIGFRLPIKLMNEFKEHTDKIGLNKGFILRKLVTQWLKEVKNEYFNK